MGEGATITLELVYINTMNSRLFICSSSNSEAVESNANRPEEYLGHIRGNSEPAFCFDTYARSCALSLQVATTRKLIRVIMLKK